jgi:hypothetical protein
MRYSQRVGKPYVVMRKIFNLIKDLSIWIKAGCKLSKASFYRLAICFGCEFFNEDSMRCKKCGCNMKLKTKLDTAKCPINKW